MSLVKKRNDPPYICTQRLDIKASETVNAPCFGTARLLDNSDYDII